MQNISPQQDTCLLLTTKDRQMSILRSGISGVQTAAPATTRGE